MASFAFYIFIKGRNVMIYDLNYKGFEQNLLFRRDDLCIPFDRVQYIFRFGNNYGASVVKGHGTYGYERDLWELGVIYFYRPDKNNYHLTYDTPITDDVEGYLTDEKVRELLKRIKEL